MCRDGVVLASREGACIVFRVTLFSIVLALAAGPSVSAFCKVWCVPHAAAQSGCHGGDDTGAGLQAVDNCQDETLTRITAVKEEFRRATAADHDHAVPVPRQQVGGRGSPDLALNPRVLAPPTHGRPLSTPLRI